MRFPTLAVLALAMFGCSQPSPPVTPSAPDGQAHVEGDHDHGHADGHDHVHDAPITKADVKMPANFAELVARLEEYRTQVKSAIDAGKPQSGHRALDELEIVLAETMSLAQASVPEGKLAAVNEARQTLLNAFREIHQNIDADDKPGYDTKEPAIQKSIATLKEIASSTSAR